MEAKDLRKGIRVRTTREIKDFPGRPGFIIPKGTVFPVKRVTDGKVYVSCNGKDTEINPKHLERAG